MDGFKFNFLSYAQGKLNEILSRDNYAASFSCQLNFCHYCSNVLQIHLKEARKGFYLHAHAQSTHAITKMHASAE